MEPLSEFECVYLDHMKEIGQFESTHQAETNQASENNSKKVLKTREFNFRWNKVMFQFLPGSDFSPDFM